jgi:hypothetical protein
MTALHGAEEAQPPRAEPKGRLELAYLRITSAALIHMSFYGLKLQRTSGRTRTDDLKFKRQQL